MQSMSKALTEKIHNEEVRCETILETFEQSIEQIVTMHKKRNYVSKRMEEFQMPPVYSPYIMHP
jgi:hypothetical protein